MPVLTQKEYESKISKEVSLPVSEDDSSLGDSELSSSRVKKFIKKKEIFTYYLLHPENGADGDLQNFEDVINIDGKDYKRSCKNGSIITEEEVLVEFLMGKGYQLMEKILKGG